MKIEEAVELLIEYAKCHFHLDEEDAIYKKNLLLKYFGLDKPFEGKVDASFVKDLKVPDVVLEPIRDYLKDKYEDSNEVELEIGWIMGLLTPLPSQVNQSFAALYDVNPVLATDYLYDLSIKNNYIAKTQVDKNILWDAHYKDGPSLEISINLSKPEKNNKDIAKLLSNVSSSYPKCMLCHENLGFWGNAKKPARENIRFVPLTLDDEEWYMQYSPYVYYSHHLICFYKKHVPMEINRRIISKLFAFVDQFPHFFIGSNSDLPIVGGSILDHEHFQGGGHEMPLMKAPIREKLCSINNVDVSILDFYNTTLRLDGKDKEKILDVAERIVSSWKKYNDPEHDIISHDEAGQHSTVTPIVRKVGENKDTYQLFLILRNNRCNEKYPGGIFHAHPEYHMIKSEGIGLIEAAGLFILPARLQRQGALIDKILEGKATFEETVKASPDMAMFEGMVKELLAKKGTVKEYINDVCRHILENVGVYKNDKSGQEALKAFVKEALK